MAKTPPDVQTFIALLPRGVEPLLDKVPAKWMDKEQAYRSRPVARLVKVLQKLPPRTVAKWYSQIQDVNLKIGRLRPARDTPLDQLAAKLMTIWRATNVVLHENEDKAGDLKKRRDEAPYGSYLSQAEMKKRRQLSRKLLERVKEWVGNRPSDPIHKMWLQAENDHRWVKTDLIRKVVQHLKTLRDRPEHEDDYDEIEDIRKELVMEGGIRMGSLRSQLIRLAHQKPELRPHLLPMLSRSASEDEAEADEEQAEADEDKAQAKREEAEAERLKQAAVAKPAIFPKFEVRYSTRDLERMVQKHYPMAVSGTLKIDRKIETYPNYGRMFFNITMENADPNAEDEGNSPITGSIIMAMEPGPSGFRAYAFFNIDG